MSAAQKAFAWLTGLLLVAGAVLWGIASWQGYERFFGGLLISLGVLGYVALGAMIIADRGHPAAPR